ncbi:ATP-binding protein [Mycobacterium sp. PS03-16]|uniref:GAF domain-containing sensor histidine kinase n=1 Tax=Mycobacterium sp. PS03-16 TaxID=2559611 RepID=UPI00352846C1
MHYTGDPQSVPSRLLKVVLRPTAPPLWLGVVVAVTFIVAETLLVLQLKRVAPENAFGALFLLGVLVVSAGWGFGLAVSTSLASALVYVYFHLEGTDSLAPAVFVFLPMALLANVLAGQARLRAAEAEQRRLEADLSAELARSTLGTGDLRAALDNAGRRIAEVLELPFAELALGELPGDAQRTAIPLADGATRIGTLLVPANLKRDARQRVQRMLGSLESLLVATRDRQQITAELEASHAEISALADQQTALRRVATLVARGADPAEVYPAAVTELAGGLDVEHVTLVDFDSDDTCVVLAGRDSVRDGALTVGERLPTSGDTLCARIRRTAEPARIDDYSSSDGPIAHRLRGLGVRAGVGAPVIVDGRVRGALLVGSTTADPIPAECEARVSDFADLVATAIANAETRAELQASRKRIITAADHARRGFERDLHDGAQQRIVSLGLEVRALDASLPADAHDVHAALDKVVSGLAGLHRDLQELSRGIHPAILSRGGLGPAVRTLARRSPVPVELDVRVDGRLPESVEVAAYYVVAEALTNAAKHARAGAVTVCVIADDDTLRLSVADDGIGGADASAGSGLIGLKDRVEAVAGRLEVASPAGVGTTLTVTIPY